MNLDKYDFSYNDWCTLIDQYIFNEDHRKIVKRRLLDGIRFEKLAEEFDMSVNNVKQIVYKSQQKLFKHMKSIK